MTLLEIGSWVLQKQSQEKHVGGTAFQAGVCDISLNRARKKPQEAASDREKALLTASGGLSRLLAASRGLLRFLAASPPMFNEMLYTPAWSAVGRREGGGEWVPNEVFFVLP